MRVLALVTDAFGGYGGIAQYNRDFLSAVASFDCVSEIRILPRLARDEMPSLPSKLIQHRPALQPLRYSINAAAITCMWRPDVIFNGHVYHGPLASRLASKSGSKLISQLHGTEVWDPLPEKHIKPLSSSNLVLCVSRDTATKYSCQPGARSANAAILNNTVSERFTIGDRPSARRLFGLTNELAILTVARLDGHGGYKGHDRIIRLLPLLGSPARPVVYLIAGSGEDRPRLEHLAEEFQVEGRVRFLDKVPDHHMPDLYRAADLFALPSTGEGFGIVYLEAMACGTPALGLNAGGAPDALTYQDLGVAVDAAAFEQKLTDMVDRCALITNDQRRGVSEYTHQRFGVATFRRRVAEVLSSTT